MPENNKVLVLSHEFTPLGGGGGRVIAFLCRELHNRGISIEVWTNSICPSKRESFPFSVRYFPTTRTAQFDTNVPAIFFYLSQILVRGLFVVRRKRFGLIVSNMALPAGIVGHILSAISGVPHVVWHHGNEVHGYNPVKGANIFFKATLKKIWPAAYANFFVSQSLLDRANKIGGLSNASILPVAAEPPVAFEKKRTSDRRIFLFAGRLVPDKNVPILLDAIEILQQKNCCDRSLFYIAGDGILNKALRNRALRLAKPEQTVFLGAIHPDKMKDLYNDAYALVLPSLMEGYPMTILEAATYGVPTIGSDTEGIADAVVHGETGLLFKLNNAEALAAAISLLAADTTLRNRLGENAFNRSRSFTYANTADILLRSVQELIRCPDQSTGNVPVGSPNTQ